MAHVYRPPPPRQRGTERRRRLVYGTPAPLEAHATLSGRGRITASPQVSSPLTGSTNGVILARAGEDVMDEFGIWVARTAPWEEARWTYTRSGSITHTDRDGSTVSAGQDVMPIEWLDRDGDGARETPAVLLDDQKPAVFYIEDVPPRIRRLAIYGAMVDQGSGALGAGHMLSGLAGDDLTKVPYLRAFTDAAGRPTAQVTNVATATSQASFGSGPTITSGQDLEWIIVMDFDTDLPEDATTMSVTLHYRVDGGAWQTASGAPIAKDTDIFSIPSGGAGTRLWIGGDEGTSNYSTGHHLRHVVFLQETTDVPSHPFML